MNDPKIKMAINELPEELKEVILSDELSETMRALAKKHKIHFDIWSMLEKEILYVLLSIKKPQDLLKTLQKTGMDDLKSQNLLKDLIDHIFKPMRTLLQKTLDKNETDTHISNDPRLPKKPRNNTDLSNPFNIGEIPEITDPYREKIEF